MKLLSPRLLNYLIVFLFIILFLGGTFLILYYFNHERNECLSNPLIFGAKQLTNNVGYEFNGYGYFKVPYGYESPTILFNSTSISIEK